MLEKLKNVFRRKIPKDKKPEEPFYCSYCEEPITESDLRNGKWYYRRFGDDEYIFHKNGEKNCWSKAKKDAKKEYIKGGDF